MLFHAGQVVMAQHARVEPVSFPLRLTKWGYVGVPIFFVLSGYCIAAAAHSAERRDDGAWSFFKARLRRIFPTYWTVLAFTVGMILFTRLMIKWEILTRSHLATVLLPSHFTDWISNLFLLQPIVGSPALMVVSWTLSYELAFYAMMACVLVTARRLRRPGLITRLPHGLTLICIAGLLVGIRMPFPFDLWAQFGFGVACFDILCRPVTARHVTACGLLISLGLVLTVIRAGDFVGVMDEPVEVVYPVAAATAGLLVVLRPGDQYVRRSFLLRPLMWLGIISYSLYLSHFALLGAANQILCRLSGDGYGDLPRVAISTALCIGFGGLLWLVCEYPLRSRHAKSKIDQSVAAVVG